ncbi:protein kinase family protein [Streptomyces erythrochromogenes]|uniref:non-specific serine/threonine protein kinase n=1 Tax=Streptomyces erythrochromogenes TaxID=285574 RepID=A0ABZ1Q8D1_9ACTN|nr:protein kinase family protein [Streptomyces erythrochromogenes]MCX5582176.1 protein kinase family protein [Streptomyces erythrochromogenes]
MAAENPGVLQQRYWLDQAWEEHEGTVYWSAFDQKERAEVFVQQLQPLAQRTGSEPLLEPFPDRAAVAGPRPPSGKGWTKSSKAAARARASKDQIAVPGDLMRQVRRVSSPRSPHLLAVHDVFEHGGSVWVVMDPVQPISLRQLLKEQGKLGGAGAAYLGVEMAAALQEMHDAGIAHGRFDPRSVFFRGDRTLALAGYGLAPSPHDGQGPWLRPWRPDSRYTAPELARHTADRPPTPSCSGDLWALGMVLYEILMGSRSLLYGPLRRFRWIRKVHDARPPRVPGEAELTLLLAVLLSPHPGARTSAAAAAVSLRRLAGLHEPMPGGHWAVANRPPRSFSEHLREQLVHVFTTATSRAMAAFLTGVLVTLVTLFGWHLVSRPSAPDPLTALLSGAVFGAAYGTVRVVLMASWHCLALLRGAPAPDAQAAPRPPAAAGAPSGAAQAPEPAASAAPPAHLLRLPACTPRLTLLDAPAHVGRAVRLEFTLDVPPGHPWHRASGDARAPAELMLVASPRGAGSTLVPPCAGYRVQAPGGEAAAFTFTAHAPGRHRLRITVYDRAHGVVLQELDATLEAEEPALLGSARHDGPEF